MSKMLNFLPCLWLCCVLLIFVLPCYICLCMSFSKWSDEADVSGNQYMSKGSRSSFKKHPATHSRCSYCVGDGRQSTCEDGLRSAGHRIFPFLINHSLQLWYSQPPRGCSVLRLWSGKAKLSAMAAALSLWGVEPTHWHSTADLLLTE